MQPITPTGISAPFAGPSAEESRAQFTNLQDQLLGVDPIYQSLLKASERIESLKAENPEADNETIFNMYKNEISKPQEM